LSESGFSSTFRKGRDTNIELNAVKEFHREYFEEIIEEAILEHIDKAAKQRVEQQITGRRELLADCIDTEWPDDDT
jgi:hypothetical protein